MDASSRRYFQQLLAGTSGHQNLNLPRSVLLGKGHPTKRFRPSEGAEKSNSLVLRHQTLRTPLEIPYTHQIFPSPEDFSTFPSPSYPTRRHAAAPAAEVREAERDRRAAKQGQAQPWLCSPRRAAVSWSHLSRARGTPRSSCPSPCRRGCSSRSAG